MTTYLDAYGFASSIVSYPGRGPDGDARYRGNTTGRIVRDFIATYHRDPRAVMVDPMEGGGTSRDAAAALGVPYRGFDLRDGFDAVRDDLLSALGAPAGSAFCHPPYAGMITYSANMWGAHPHPADLSQVGGDVDVFHEMLAAVLANIHRALQPGGVYGVLLGLWRQDGTLHDLPSRMTSYAPGRHVDAIIKVQHNTSSRDRRYEGRLVRIEHEVLHVFRRADDPSIIAVTIDVLDRIQKTYGTTWRNLVVGFAREHGTFKLADLYAAFDGHPRAGRNVNYRAKLRQVVRDEATIERWSRGRYAYVERRTAS
jgi:hypothetical protein